ncbi:hypothetical protein GOP47_0008645 [Adiantum capillus-veneris]|uniref:Uncharacterized protein n=1 Tax=Adiantum capillus-veneris TaxID=13818 RepID=A0A9D4UZD2_ADICA|nr:hypothetical protein GOP47_0008645 [Adiantum capillus-veneris]
MGKAEIETGEAEIGRAWAWAETGEVEIGWGEQGLKLTSSTESENAREQSWAGLLLEMGSRALWPPLGCPLTQGRPETQ